MAKKKNDYFFDNFVECADCSCKMATALSTVLGNFNADLLPAKLKDLHKIENSGDSLRHEMIAELTKAFITPIEREDILSLSKNIDNVTDYIEDIAIRVYTNNISQMRGDIAAFTALLIECCNTMKEMLEEFPNFRKSNTLQNYIITMNDLEEKGDEMYMEALKKLHSGTHNPIDIIVWREVYNCFEKCLDACETVANTVQWVIIRNT